MLLSCFILFNNFPLTALSSNLSHLPEPTGLTLPTSPTASPPDLSLDQLALDDTDSSVSWAYVLTSGPLHLLICLLGTLFLWLDPNVPSCHLGLCSNVTSSEWLSLTMPPKVTSSRNRSHQPVLLTFWISFWIYPVDTSVYNFIMYLHYSIRSKGRRLCLPCSLPNLEWWELFLVWNGCPVNICWITNNYHCKR